MKTRVARYAKMGWSASAIILTALVISSPAQSGRVISKPQPTPTPQAQTLSKSDAGPKVAVDPRADQYKLIFPASRDGELTFTGEEDREELSRARQSHFDQFVEELNKAGAQGYRLISSIDGSVAVVKLDEAQYEYAWFETTGSAPSVKSGFAGRYAQLAQRGFRLADHTRLSVSCESLEEDEVSIGEDCTYRDLFLLVREKGVEEEREHRLVSVVQRGAWGRGKPYAAEMTTRTQEELAAGFYPTCLLSKFEILFEKIAEDDPLPTDNLDMRVLRSSSFWEHDHLPREVNKLAQQGYSLALANNEIAVMYRRGEATPPLTYVWLNAQDKSFEKQLAKLQESGAVYRMTYPDGQGDKNKLIFEQTQGGDGKRREYRVLRFELQSVENAPAKKVTYALAPSSKDTMKLLNQLAGEGFAVRDLFISSPAKLGKTAGPGRAQFISKMVDILLERAR